MTRKSLVERWFGFDSRLASRVRWTRAIETNKIRYKILSHEIKTLKDILRHKHESIKVYSTFEQSVFARELQYKKVQARITLRKIKDAKIHLHNAETEGNSYI